MVGGSKSEVALFINELSGSPVAAVPAAAPAPASKSPEYDAGSPACGIGGRGGHNAPAGICSTATSVCSETASSWSLSGCTSVAGANGGRRVAGCSTNESRGCVCEA